MVFSKKGIRKSVKIISYYLGISLGVSLILSYFFVHSLRKRISQSQRRQVEELVSTQKVHFENVAMRTRDGLQLKGWFFKVKDEAPTIVFIHGHNDNRFQGFLRAKGLLQNGMNVLTFDLRGHGESQGSYCTYGYYEKNDIAAVLDYLETRHDIDTRRFYLMGSSMGAAIAIQAAEDPRVKAVIAEGPYANLREVALRYATLFGLIPKFVVYPAAEVALRLGERVAGFHVSQIEVSNCAKKVRCPILLIHGTSDWQIPCYHSERIFANVGSQKYLWLVEKARHDKCYRVSGEEYIKRICDFINGRIG